VPESHMPASPLPGSAMLEGKVAIVSGIGPGMGRDIALLLARHGADVVLGARRTEKSEEVAAEVRALGRQAEVVALDITDADACEAAVARAVQVLGGVDILVNNAFHDGNRKGFLDAPLDEWRTTMDVNLWGTLQMTRAAVPAIIERGGGSIVMINSMSTHRIEATYGAYAASKGALETATKTLSVELGPHAIRVNGIFPGYIWGDSVEWYFGYLGKKRGISGEEVYEEVSAQTSLKYLPHSSEIAGSVVFFASDLSKPVTGQSLDVNCGHWMAP